MRRARHARPLPHILPLLVLFLAALGPVADAQEPAGLRLLNDGPEAVARPGAEGELTWTLAAVDGQSHFVLASATSGSPDWRIRVEPAFANIPAGETATFTAFVRPTQDPEPSTLEVVVLFEDSTSNQTLAGTGTVEAAGFGRILGMWDNPLPPPLHGAEGTFLLNILAWMAVAAAVMLLVSPTLKVVTMRTRTTVDDAVIRIIARPVFFLVFLYGLRASASTLRLPDWAFGAIDALWLILSVAVVAVAAFRLWHEVVVAFGRRTAGRTSSTLDDRLLPVVEKTGSIGIVLIAAFYIFDGFGWSLGWLAAGGAIGGLVIAFAAQDTLGNFFAGLHLLVDQPFKEGDDIILETGEVCTVRHVGLRSTQLYHVANHEVIIVPNSLLANHRIVNIMRPDNLYKVKVDVGVAYGTDVQKVKAILMEIAERHPLSLEDPEHRPFVRFNAFGASSLDFALHVWIQDVYARFAVASDLREMVEQRFAEEGIEIPFPQRVMWQGREEAERDDPPRAPKALELHGGPLGDPAQGTSGHGADMPRA